MPFFYKWRKRNKHAHIDIINRKKRKETEEEMETCKRSLGFCFSFSNQALFESMEFFWQNFQLPLLSCQKHGIFFWQNFQLPLLSCQKNGFFFWQNCQCEQIMAKLHSYILVLKSWSNREKNHVKSKKFCHSQSC